MVRSLVWIVALGSLAAAPAAHAQRPKQDNKPANSQSQGVPPKMCRVWLDGVPADRQPAPTDCATAMRNRPPNARIIFGKDSKDSDERTSPRRSGVDSTKPDDNRKGRPEKKKKPE